MKGKNIKSLPIILAVLVTIYYIIIFSTYTILLHKIFYTQAFDAGIEDQAIWLFSQGMTPFITVRGMHSFADHIRFYQIFLAPLFWFWNDINVLFIIQALILGSGAIFLFLFAQERIKNHFLALSITFSYLLYPALQNLNLDQFHTEALIVLPMILTLIFLLQEKYFLFYIFLMLSLIGKEDVALTTLFIGLFLILFKRNWKHGLAVMTISLGWYLICSKILMPYFNSLPLGSQVYSHWFRGFFANIFNPQFYLQNFLHPESLRYYQDLLFPLAGLPLLAPQFVFLLLPPLTINVLSGVGYLRSIYYHYNYLTIPILFIALIEGLRYLSLTQKLGEKAKIMLALILVFSSFYFNTKLSHFPFWSHLDQLKKTFERLNTDEAITIKNRALSLISPAAKVSASYSLVPHLTHRREIYMFPNPFKACLWGPWFQEGKDLPPPLEHVDYVVIDWSNHGIEEKELVRSLSTSSQFITIFNNNPIIVLKNKRTSFPLLPSMSFTTDLAH